MRTRCLHVSFGVEESLPEAYYRVLSHVCRVLFVCGVLKLQMGALKTLLGSQSNCQTVNSSDSSTVRICLWHPADRYLISFDFLIQTNS